MELMKKLIFKIMLLFTIGTIGQTNHLIKTDYGTIHYKIYGQGAPILIINGGPGMNCEGFSSLAKLLNDDYMVILYDQRGTGKSKLNSLNSNTLNMDLLVEDIEVLRKHLKINKWAVLGHSFGGFLAQHYASKHSNNLTGMILSGSGGIDMDIFTYLGANFHIRQSAQEKDSLNYWRNKIKKGDTTYLAKYKVGRFRAPLYLYGDKYIEKVAHRLTQGKPEISKLIFQDLHEKDYNWKNAMSKLEIPVLIIQGRQDMVGSGTAYKAHNVYKNSRLIFLNECGHYGWLEQEERYITEIKSFVKNLN